MNIIIFVLSLFLIRNIEASFLKVIGNKLYDENGNEVRLTGVNWFGFETGNYVPHGLWSRDYKSMIMQIRDLGFNCIRIPWCNEMLRKTTPRGLEINPYGNDAYAVQKGIKLYPQAPEGYTGINLDLDGLTPLQILDKIIEEAGKYGLKIILDNHSRKADGYMNETLWYTQDFSEQQWIEDWVFLAQRYKGNPTVIGADLDNEPHGNTGMGMKPPASWGYELPQYYTAWAQTTDWAAAAERCGNAILEVNPDWLIIVEGVEQYQNDYYWWGGNLMGVAKRPINLIKPEKLVYSPHEYGPEVYNQSWFSDPNFPNNMPEIWYKHFGFIYDQNIGHLLVGEFGIKNQSNTTAYTWFTEFMKYMGSKYSWTFWCFNPNSGDTGGILQDDWVSVHEWKMEVLRPHLAPLITSSTSYQPKDNPPVVNIQTPSNNSTVSGKIEILVVASDDKGISKLELYIDQQKLTETSTSTIRYTLNTTLYTNGVYTIKAIAYDTTNKSSQKQITININNKTSQFLTYINIVFPLNNQVLSGQTTVYIQASSDVYKVELYLNDSLVSSKQHSPYEFLLNTYDYSNATYTLKAVGVSFSTVVISEISITINNVHGDELPTLYIELSTSSFSNIMNFKISASDDNKLTRIEIYISEILVSSIVVNSYAFEVDYQIDISNFSSGEYILQIIAYDDKGQTSSFVSNVEIYNQTDSSSNQNEGFKKVYLLSLNSDGINEKIVFPLSGVKIFSSNGTLIKKLDSLEWNGKDENGRLVSSGVYFYIHDSVKNKGKNKGVIFVIK
ncbi:MAG: cellulase family glycosylhydrolase [Endomicrobiia bacterium]